MGTGGPSDGFGVSRGFPRTELGLRVASALVLVVVALAAAYAGGWVFAGFWLVAGAVTAAEWLGITRAEPRAPLLAATLAGLALLTVVHLAAASPLLGLAAVALAGLGVAALARTARDRGWALLGLPYAAVVVIVPPLVREHPDLGIEGLLWMFAVVWASDVAAFFTGRALGGPKLWPRVSPKKTWSGFCGGLVAAVLAGVGVAVAAGRYGNPPPVGIPAVVVLSALASVLSQLGDLGESALKRAFGVKDSGRSIPGHGGVMDRVDGFWAVCLLVGAILAAARIAGP